MEEFKVGDKVFSYSFQQWGEVVDYDMEQVYPLTIKIGGNLHGYAKEGRLYCNAKAQDLFFDEVSIIPPPRPLPKLEIDTKFLVSNLDIDDDNFNIWHKRYFSHFEDGKIHCFVDGTTSWSGNKKTTSWLHWKLLKDENK